MYKFALLLLFFFAAFKLSAQEDTKAIMDRLNALESRQSQIVSNLESRIKADSLKIIMLMDSLKRNAMRMNELTGSMETYKSTISSQSAILADVTKKVELGSRSRYEAIKKNLILSTEIYEELNQRLTTLYAFSQVESYRTALGMLNNPSDESLGFSFNKKIEELLEQKIPMKRNKSNIMQMATVFLQNPTVSAIGSAIPFYSVGSSLVSYIASITSSEKDVRPSHVMEFKDEMEKYISFYSRLNHLNTGFVTNLDNFKYQSSSLHAKLEDYVTKTLKSGGFPMKSRAEMGARNESEYLTALFNEFNHKTVRAFFKKMEEKYTRNGKIDYDAMLRENANIFEMNRVANEVSFFYRNFEILYTQYTSMLEENCKGTIEVLEDAKSKRLTSETSKIDQQIRTLRQRKDDAANGIRTAVNIQKVSNLIEQFETVGY